MEFWELIESSGSPDKNSCGEQCENIISKLSGFDKKGLIQFSSIHSQLLANAYTWPLIKACYIVMNHLSDDIFEDFSNWLILNGRERFESAIKDPDTVASFIFANRPAEEISGEALLYVCEEAWDGDIEEIEEQVIESQLPNVEHKWPSVEVLETEFPRLFKRYWDQAKHS